MLRVLGVVAPSLSRLLLAGLVVLAGGAVLAVTVLDLEPPLPLTCLDGTSACVTPGCTVDTGDPVTGVVHCCKNHSRGRGCCTYRRVQAYYCHNAQGQRCSRCGGTYADIAGTCSESSYPDAATQCVGPEQCTDHTGQCE